MPAGIHPPLGSTQANEIQAVEKIDIKKYRPGGCYHESSAYESFSLSGNIGHHNHN